MKRTLSTIILCGCVFGMQQIASAATIYTQNWGGANTTVQTADTLSLVGWTVIANRQGGVGPYYGIFNAAGANDPFLGLGLTPNTVYFTTLVGTNQLGGPGMFYTTTESGSGSAGNSSFVSIDPTLYPNLTLNAEVRSAGGNLTNYFAVRVGGSWYVETAHQMPLYAGDYPTFTNATLIYTNAENVWNNLTLGATAVTIGGVASPNLSAPITGIGIVEVADTGATGFPGFNYNQIVINQGPGDFPSSPPVNTVTAVTPQTVYAGGGVSFVTAFSGTPNLIYRWQSNGLNLNNGGRIFGATSNILTITNVTADDALPTYSVFATNFFGSATNDNIHMVVNPRPPEMLYAETFPYVGPTGQDLPVAGVGWLATAIAGTSGIFQSGPGLGSVYSYSGSAETNVYYTTTTSDTGVSGLPFLPINPANYPAVTLQAQFAPGNGAGTTAANITVYWAVQMSGVWYASAEPVATSLVQNSYLINQLAFKTAATNWNNLAIDGNNVTIGGEAAGDLAGNITGAGVIIVHNNASGASMNFQNFTIVTNEATILPPTIGTTGVPWDQTVAAGGGVSFGVTASGAQPLTYGWTLNNTPLANGPRVFGANTPTLTISSLTTADSGSIVAFVTNSAGLDRSDNYFPVALTVNNPPVGTIYTETFPFVGPQPGNYPISTVGWVEAVPGVPNALFQRLGGDGAVFAFLGTPAATVYYTSTASDTNQAGLPFPNINLAGYSDMAISVDIAPTFAASNVTAFVAVQLNGSSWYVAATALPVPTATDSGTYSAYNTPFNPAAANWKDLTITATGALIESPAGSNLKGVMTGVGLVFVTTGTGGTFNFDNLSITGSGVGGINVGPKINGNINLSWVGNPVVNLQSTTNLTTQAWQDVPNSVGVYSLPVSGSTPGMFFRLVGP